MPPLGNSSSTTSSRGGPPPRALDWTPFDADSDYRVYVDGKARYDGVRSFLASRDIALPEGAPDDPPDVETVCGLGNRKNGYFIDEVERHGVKAFESTVRLVRSLQQLGIGTAIISASENATVDPQRGGHRHAVPRAGRRPRGSPAGSARQA